MRMRRRSAGEGGEKQQEVEVEEDEEGEKENREEKDQERVSSKVANDVAIAVCCFRMSVTSGRVFKRAGMGRNCSCSSLI